MGFRIRLLRDRKDPVKTTALITLFPIGYLTIMIPLLTRGNLPPPTLTGEDEHELFTAIPALCI